MALRVYNTLTKQKEEFIPKEAGKVGMYVCGVTPYNHPHIGNARPFVTWDVIKRYFTKKGYEVKHIQNFTDVDDKIIKRANEEGISSTEVAQKYKEILDKEDGVTVPWNVVTQSLREELDNCILLCLFHKVIHLFLLSIH